MTMRPFSRRLPRATVVGVAVAVLLLAGAAGGAEYVFQLGGGLSEDHPHTIAHRFFADRVAELTGNRVEIRVFPNNQLGAERERIEGLQMGALDFTKVMTSVLANFQPAMNVFSLPYLYRDNDHFLAVINSDVGRDMMRDLEAIDIKGIAWYYAGSRCVYNARRPVVTPDDLRGLKIRVPENPVMIDVINAMGGTGVPVNLAEIYAFIRLGVVDGAENSSLLYAEQQHCDVAPFFSTTNHMIDTNILLMSRYVWNSLPADIQTAIEQAGRETQEFCFTTWLAREEEFTARLRHQGVAFIRADVAAFRDACAPVWERHGAALPAGLLEAILAVE
ncbi:MAG: TRAP transporter substrate-binding protein [Planctomycetes bacterium]|nr:TRAP transporter substrate-binding protein [Planctomycetota bacterium]